MRKSNIQKRRERIKNILLADPYLRHDPDAVLDLLVEQDTRSYSKKVKRATVIKDIQIVMGAQDKAPGPSPILKEIIDLGRLWRSWEDKMDLYNETTDNEAQKEARKVKNKAWEAVRHHWDRLNIVMEKEPSGGGTMTRLIQTERRNKLKQLLPYHRDITSLAQALQVSVMTVRRDLEAIKDDGLGLLDRISVDEIFERYVLEANAEDRTLVRIIQDKSENADDGTKIKAITTRADGRERVIRVGQTLGIIPKAADKLTINLTIEERKTLAIAILDRVAVPLLDHYIEDPAIAIEAVQEAGRRIREIVEGSPEQDHEPPPITK